MIRLKIRTAIPDPPLVPEVKVYLRTAINGDIHLMVQDDIGALYKIAELRQTGIAYRKGFNTSSPIKWRDTDNAEQNRVHDGEVTR